MFRTKLLIFLVVVGCSLPLAAYDAGLFVTQNAIHNRQRVLVITGYRGYSKTVVVPASINGIPVRIIGDNAFRQKFLLEVFMPEGIEVIGPYAFAGNQLRAVMIPSSVKFIAPSAFDNNTLRLTKGGARWRDYISGEMTTVISGGDYAPRAGCIVNDRQPPVVFLSQPEDMMREAYVINEPMSPYPVPTVRVRPSVTFAAEADVGGVLVRLNSDSGIGNLSYSNAGLTAVAIPQQARFIGYGAFLSNNLTGVVIPPSVRWIGSQAFMGNPVMSVTIGENVSMQYDSFRFQFSDYYRMNNYRAGTYILKAGHWNFEGQEPQPRIYIMDR